MAVCADVCTHLPTSYLQPPLCYKVRKRSAETSYSQQDPVILIKVQQLKADKMVLFLSIIKVLGLSMAQHFTHLLCISMLHKWPCSYLEPCRLNLPFQSFAPLRNCLKPPQEKKSANYSLLYIHNLDLLKFYFSLSKKGKGLHSVERNIKDHTVFQTSTFCYHFSMQL